MKKLGEGIYICTSEITFELVRMWLKKLHPHFESNSMGNGEIAIISKDSTQAVRYAFRWESYKRLDQQEEFTQKVVEEILQKLLA